MRAVLDLGEQPLANALLTREDLAREEPRYPLAIVRCESCSLVQLTHSVSPEELFVEYAYFSSSSAPMVDHARELVDLEIETRSLGDGDLVLEIASNDGYLLQHYVAKGIPVLGVDPASNVVGLAREKGVETMSEFFTLDLGRKLAAEGKRASVVHANNVLAHVPDINDLVAGVAAVLRDEGVFVVETPYVRDMVEKLEFDTIYHEHVFYYSVRSLQALFERHGLRIIGVQSIPIHGGSLRVHAVRSGSPEVTASSVAEFVESERHAGMDADDFYAGFSANVADLLTRLREFLAGRKEQGRTIAGYGAAAKATVLLNAAGIGRDTIDFVIDATPYKHGRYIPGARIPIHPIATLMEEMPDDVVIFAWNFAAEIMRKESDYVDKGGTFLLPLPEPRVAL